MPLLTAAVRVLLWVLVAAGAVGGITAALRPASTPRSAPAARAESVPAEVVGYAELSVRRWLDQAGEETPTSATGARAANGSGVAAGASATAVGARVVSTGYWAITIAADVVDRGAAGGATPGVWFVEVGVTRDGAGHLALTSTPALVPGPPDVEVPTLAAPAWRTPSRGDPVADAVARFTEALLTGTGDVSRYLAPGVELRAIDQPPFVSTSLARLAVEHLQQGELRARALIEGRTASGSMAFVAYELRMEERAGRGEVAAVSGAPALGARRAPADRTTTTTIPATPGA